MFTRFKTCLCEKFEILPILLIHRFIWVLMFFGWMFNDKSILVSYVIFLMLLRVHWIFNNNECVVTQIERNICQFPEDSYSDYFYNFCDKENIDFYYGSIQLFICLVVFHKLLS